MLRRYASIFIFFTIISTVFITLDTCIVKGENTLYVGGSGDGNYSTIQNAIDRSSENDTIFVFSGTYYENLVINKSINLVGLDNTHAIINGTYGLYVIQIESSYVTVSGFSIIHGKVGILVIGPDYISNNFSDNLIFENWEGIRLYNTSKNYVFQNIIQNNSNYGIISYESSENKISDNTFIDNSKAIFLGRWSDRNIISNNNITKNSIGIYLDYSSNNKINQNLISKNSDGVYLIYSNSNNITNNNIQNTSGSGIYLSESNDNVVSPNTFFDNNQNVKEDTGLPKIKTPGFEILIMIFAMVVIFILNKKKSQL